MSKRAVRRRHSGDDRRSEHLAELAAQLKPLEESAGHRTPTGPLEGSIRVDEIDAPVPNVIVQAESKRWLGIEMVVLIIAGLMLVFIASIAWQISLMPGPGKP